MSIDITMSAGWGFHVPEPAFERWLEANDPGGEGVYDVLEDLFSREKRYPALTFFRPSNDWLGVYNGVVILTTRSYTSVDMGREPRAGVYTPDSVTEPPGTERVQLEHAAEFFGGGYPIQYLIAVAVY